MLEHPEEELLGVLREVKEPLALHTCRDIRQIGGRGGVISRADLDDHLGCNIDHRQLKILLLEGGR